MSVRVAFVEDPIRKNGSLMARLVLRNKVDFDQLLDYMQNSTGLAETDMRAVFVHFMNALVFFLSSDGQVHTTIGTFALSLGKNSPRINRSHLADRKINMDMITLRLRPDSALLDRVKLATNIEVVDMPPPTVPGTISGGKPGTDSYDQFRQGWPNFGNHWKPPQFRQKGF